MLLEQHHGHEIADPNRCLELLPLADTIFCEWCLGNADWYSQHKLSRQRLIIRLHSQEFNLPFLDRIQWSKVNALILICPRNRDRMLERYPYLEQKIHLVYNAIDCPTLNQAKLPGAEFNLGILGISPKLKAPHLALEIFHQLKKIDRRYTLFIKGKHPRDYDWLWSRPDERAYFERFYHGIQTSPFLDSIVFEPYGDDVARWFSKIGFVLSTSDSEGSHQSVAEGMASGAIPVIRNWPGADLVYPPKYVVNSVAAAVEAIVRWNSPDLYEREVRDCRVFARDHFDQRRICRRLVSLVQGSVQSNICRQRSGSSRKIIRFQPMVDGAMEPPRNGVELPHREARATPSLSTIGLPASPMGGVPINGASTHHWTGGSVLILGYLPPGFRGGYRIRIEQEIMALLSQGVKLHLACLHPGTDDYKTLDSHRAELTLLGCPVHLVPIKGFFDLKLDETALGASMDILAQIIEEHHIGLVHAEALYCTRIGLLLQARCDGLRLVFDCHGASPEEERMSGAHPARVSTMQSWERRALTEADLTILVSKAMHRYFRRTYGLSDMRHVVVPCCVAEERFAQGVSTAAVIRLPPGRLILVYLGTMAAWQCGEEMIRLFAQLHRRNRQFFFLLLMPQADQARTIKWMAQYRLPGHCVRLAELPHSQVTDALQQAHAGVLLRRAHPVNEVSSPTKFGEYLAAGLPIIMTPGIGDFSQMTVDHGIGLVLDSTGVEIQESSAPQLDRIVEFMRETASKREIIAAKCRALAREQLHWDAASTVLATEYQRMGLSRGRPHSCPRQELPSTS